MDTWSVRIALAAGIVSILLASVLVPGLKAASPQSADIFVQVLGGTTELAAQKAYLQTDVYLHAGVTAGDLNGDGQPSRFRELPFIGLIRRLHGETAPKVHRHVQGEEEKELLPWFIAAVRLNPQHIDAWRDGSYWFYRTGDLHRAEEFISEGIRCNPGDYRLYLDRGILYHRLKKWESSIRDLETAQKLWKNDSEDAACDYKAIRLYLDDSRKRLKSA
ncbi:MAG TPA: hypothetical protein VMX94_13275 [Armatimonadota bacterium]|nr:hypothetical protein [Armatimonadota bacterium]